MILFHDSNELHYQKFDSFHVCQLQTDPSLLTRMIPAVGTILIDGVPLAAGHTNGLMTPCAVPPMPYSLPPPPVTSGANDQHTVSTYRKSV